MKKSDIKRLLKNPKFWVFITVMAIFPFVFNWIFRGSKQSHFFDIESALSVSDWAGFWSTYTSMLVTATLAYLAVWLSGKIEENQDARQMETDRAKFAILEISSENERTFEIVLPKDIISVKKVSIESAVMRFGDETSIDLKLPQIIPDEQSELDGKQNKEKTKNGQNETSIYKNELKGRKFKVEIPHEYEEDDALMFWKRQMYNRNEKYFVAEFDVIFKYWLLSATKERIIKTLHSVADVMVGLDDKNNEQYKVVNTGVFFDEIKDEDTES